MVGNLSQYVDQVIENKKELLCNVSDFVWSHPETRFEEYKSMEMLCQILEQEGFDIERGSAGIDTAFVATFGRGGPVIGLLGEYDALAGLSQVDGLTKKKPVIPNANGHGCGHNLLGVGSLAAAIAIKSYLETSGINGTIKYFGCPGEEGGSGKTFMVREGVFDSVDIALTWHPSFFNLIISSSTLANYQVKFSFKGISAHAAKSPHLGRSALDAVELMNIGVNYLREHVKPEVRMHYSITNTGGHSPNVVQSDAEVLHLIRSPHIEDVKAIYQRMCKIAKGAALMTETQVSIKIERATSNFVPNRTLEKVLNEKMIEIGTPNYTDEEIAFAKNIWSTLNEEEKANVNEYFKDDSEMAVIDNKYLADFIFDYNPTDEVNAFSTDVGDVSWVVPTAQCEIATWAIGTPAHSWQVVTQGTTSIAHKGMLQAGKVLALTGIEVLNSPTILEKIKDEHDEKFKNVPYECPIPSDVKPSKPKVINNSF